MAREKELTGLVLGTGHYFSMDNALTAEEILRTAIASGVKVFDSADTYANGAAEHILGNVLKTFPRSGYVLCSKTGFKGGPCRPEGGFSPKRLSETCKSSLSRLKTNFLDIYMCHCDAPESSLLGIIRGMANLMSIGMIKSWGFCNWTIERAKKTLLICEKENYPLPEYCQYELNLLTEPLARRLFRRLQKHEIKIMAYSPYAQGVLTDQFHLRGQYRNGASFSSQRQRLNKKIKAKGEMFIKNFSELSEQTGYSKAQLSLSWTLQFPGVNSVVFGASKPDQVQETAGYVRNPPPDSVLKSLSKLDFSFPQ